MHPRRSSDPQMELNSEFFSILQLELFTTNVNATATMKM